jgi:hypothetical protein
MNGKIILGGINSSSSVSSTSQILMGENGAAISSNGNNVIINPSSTSSSGQIIITPGTNPNIKVNNVLVSLDGHTHDGRYYTESEIDAKLNGYLPLAGGIMNTNAYISWNASDYSDSVSDWSTVTGTGLRIFSSTSTESGAPSTYCTALHVKGSYGF